ncbi:response regulator [Phyllobacterium zundukense]|uniref:Response regulator n=1 Tax=Phyllobacterium zundukense TaxID=1867719 RepID=A0ACD4CXU5_9HYPH|nr:response regulator [Phyllobacterium zundukense]UXN58378.1 response regulator [Phyllobacterium zundukense]
MDKLLAGRRILVVEDEVLVLMMIEDMLADLGCRSVTTATRADHAVSLIENQSFDAAMLDMNLNGQTSRSVADALAMRAVPFVFATGNSIKDIWDGYGDRAIIRKPFMFEELVDTLTCLLRNSSMG